MDSEGAEVKKVEQFVLDAYTYTEAETRMTQICEYEGIRPFEITQLTKTNLIEVIRYPECDKWFRVKVAMTTFDADRGTEKESNQHILLSATDVRDAYDKVSQHMTNRHQISESNRYSSSDLEICIGLTTQKNAWEFIFTNQKRIELQ